ncbi:MAG: secretin N-terminal domain-containing protein [Verrucomicrobiales bacterium]|nr:secretin N-terminal domain-containing protein [Verrucomicrobiales bacterium]
MSHLTSLYRLALCCAALWATSLLTVKVCAQSDRIRGATLQVNFPDAPVAAILPYYEKLTSKKIIRDANLEGGNISIVTDANLTREEAIRFIDSAFLLNGYAILPVDDNTLKIINYNNGKSLRAQELPVITDPLSLPVTEQVVNYVMHLEHSTPDEAIDTFSQIVTMNAYGAMTPLNKSNSIVITESTPVIRMLLNFKRHVDVPPNELMHEFVELERADAEKVAEIINGIIDDQLKHKFATTVQVSVQPPGKDKAAPTPPRERESTGVSIVPYRRTNSILVVAPPADFGFVENLIRSFDRPSDGINFMKRKLQYVSVLDYMPSFYNALSRGTDIEKREDILEAGQLPLSAGQSRDAASDFQTASSLDSAGSSAAARNLLGSPDDVGTPVSYTVGNTLLIGDPQANSLVVSGSPENIGVIDRLIDEIDVQPMQVYLSTIIGQLNIGDDMDYSLNALHSLATFQTPSGNRLSGAASIFNGADTQPTVTDLTSTAGFPSAFQGLSLYGRFAWGDDNAAMNSMLRLFTRDTRFKILSRPSVYAQNNVKAVISSGQRIAIPTSTLTSGIGFNNGLGGAITSNIEFRDVVLKLEVIPLINSDNQVTLKIAQVNDNIIGSQTISGNEIPTLSTQELVTTVTLNSGETMVLGGLITERADEAVTGLPGIRRIPFLGKALGSTSTKESREELLIFIQPHIINGINHRCPNGLEKCRSEIFGKSMAFADPDRPYCCSCGVETCEGGDKCMNGRHASARKLQADPVDSGKRPFQFRMSSRRR